ncbi:hypothetical protein WOLCODRAFT_132044 [Wolfiporia cocos MD-104 SS10]|uniref:F-box domain-containing protein n=1 Tax=Wolfiporia cocos (strain MD-104) TaxID=742152 RepID=A0A2H3JJC1_WOLCO|nr:hypothetical protein WOLCODRAFT_132044 [Wolfiporia cocos MD-104 SS10]
MDKDIYRREPSREEILEAKREIKGHEHAIRDLEERIALLGVIALARRIPEELLSKIFEYCIDDWTRAPMAVSQVCSAWRRAARAPRVWAHVYADLDSPGALARTRFWLSMARHVPLDITIMSSHLLTTQHCALLDLLVQHATRWRRLTVHTIGLPALNALLARIARVQTPMPFLRQVQFEPDLGELPGTDDVRPLRDAFTPENSPSLTDVVYSSRILLHAPFPLHLRHLDLSFKESPSSNPLSSSILANALEGVPSLRTLALTMPLDYEGPFQHDIDLTRSVSLPELETLALYGPTDMNLFLVHLHTPALRRLHLRSLEDLGYRQSPIGPSLVHFLAAASPPIELLELHDIDLTHDAFAACFAALPTLRELRLHESSISDATLRLLYGPRGLCPRLSKIDLRWCQLLSGRELVELVRSRNDMNAHGGPEAAAVDPVADLVSEVAVLNCCFVGEKDVMQLASLTVCRITMRPANDYCRKLRKP